MVSSTPSNTFLLDWKLRARPYQPSLADLTDALVAEWQQIPAARSQNLVASLSGCYNSSILVFEYDF